MHDEDGIVNNNAGENNNSQLGKNIEGDPVPVSGHGLGIRHVPFFEDRENVPALEPVVPGDSQKRTGNRQRHCQHNDERPEKRGKQGHEQ